jgi:GNAT superfamily N-acetyltransferase
MTSQTMEIRTASLEHADSIIDFNIALCLESEGKTLDRSIVSEGVKRFILEPSRGKYFVAIINGEVVGQTAYTFEWSDWRNGEIWWIQSVYVKPNFRGIGVFTSLFEHIKQLGEANSDCCGIRLYMERENSNARQSYARLGFEETGYEVFENLFKKQT